MEELAPAPLITVSTILAETGAYGLVWLDEELTVTAKYGSLVADVEICEPVTLALPALFGFENDIKVLSGNPGKLFVLPNVSMPTRALDRDGKNAPRLNLTAFWSPRDNQFNILVARTSSASQADIDISQQMRLRLMAEEALAQKSRELEVANRDLEEYAEIISHDLSAPLRAIRYLTEDVETAMVTCDRASAEKSLADLRTQSKRMSNMMLALLDYASLGRKDEYVETVDTRALVSEIVKSLPRLDTMSVVIEGDWPSILTMRAPLDLVIRNLIDNALKHHDRDTGTVTVSALACNGDAQFRFAVSDDGPGIDQRHHGAIMLPFRTLQTSPPVEAPDLSNGKVETTSHGMGLALVKRTVETAGGTLTLKSDPSHGRGTVFTVIWPVQTDVQHT